MANNSPTLLYAAFNGENADGRSQTSQQVSAELFKQGVLEHAVWLGKACPSHDFNLLIIYIYIFFSCCLSNTEA